jgi:hypothetical protein
MAGSGCHAINRERRTLPAVRSAHTGGPIPEPHLSALAAASEAPSSVSACPVCPSVLPGRMASPRSRIRSRALLAPKHDLGLPRGPFGAESCPDRLAPTRSRTPAVRAR